MRIDSLLFQLKVSKQSDDEEKSTFLCDTSVEKDEMMRNDVEVEEKVLLFKYNFTVSSLNDTYDKEASTFFNRIFPQLSVAYENV
jgi:hypothetical protein